MAWYRTFLDKIIPAGKWNADGTTPSGDAVVIDIPAELYYKQLAVYTAVSLISNAVSRAEIKVYKAGKPVKDREYYLLNVSPNRNETSSFFWHRVINKMISDGEALIVEADNHLYCADSFARESERPVLGDVYSHVSVGSFSFDRVFTQDNSYMIRLDDVHVRTLIDGMYGEYGKILSSAAKAIRVGNGQKYKLHIEGAKAGDEEFNKEFESYIKKQLKSYMESDSAVYPEFDGYDLRPEEHKTTTGKATDFVALRKDMAMMVAGAFHIPESMMTGQITSVKDIVGSFLTFGVDPYADAITEALNKTGGPVDYTRGNYYRVDTSKIQHHSLFDVAAATSTLLSSGVMCIDELREELDRAPLNTDWSRQHFITKNFAKIETYLKEGETV